MTNMFENPLSLFSASNCFKTLMLSSSIILSMSLSLMNPPKTFIFEWTAALINSSQINVPIIFDPMGLLFSSTILFISSNVMMFANTYMMKDKNTLRFTHLVLLFILSMNILILFPNMLTLMLGWDGLGLTSFLLVIFYQNHKSLASGMLTVLSNRLGDTCLLMTITMSASQGHWNSLSLWTELLNTPPLISSLVLLAAMTKSAQLPFSSWLPAAMAAPTPVSALVHSSTLVTAGIFILIRFYHTLSQYPPFNNLLMTTGLLTMFFGSYWAMTNSDMKQVVALSTLSQLGLMSTTLSFGLISMTYAHLITHAMFKALLFMCVGLAILAQKHTHGLCSTQLVKSMPTIGFPLALSLFSMNAFPFLTGFFSKDLILESLVFSPSSIIIILTLFTSTACTATYSVRLFRGNYYSPWNTHNTSSHYSDNKNMFTPLSNMTIGSVMVGSPLMWLMFTKPTGPPLALLHFFPMVATLSGVSFALTTCFLFYRFNSKKKFKSPPSAFSPPKIFSLKHLSLRLFRVYDKMIDINPAKSNTLMMGGIKSLPSTLSSIILYLSMYFYQTLDQGWLELISPQTLMMNHSTFLTPITSWSEHKLIPLVLLFFFIFPLLMMMESL